MKSAAATLRASPVLSLVLVLSIAAQAAFWAATHRVRPDLDVVPEVPSKAAVQALSLGDEQFFFRSLALMLQNSGDTYGRFTSLRYYDYEKLTRWFSLLDELDAKSNMIPSLVAYYYSQTQNAPDTRYLVNYLYAHAMRDVAHKWWWLVQSIYIAMHKLDDMDLALKVAGPLVSDGVPVWAQQLAAVVHEKRGEMEDALKIMETIRDHAENIPEADLKFMNYFVEERLKKMDEWKRGEAARP